MTTRNTRRGFTLIELLVVVLIIGILAAVALPQYQKAVEKSRASEAIAMIRSLETAVDLWIEENGFPTSGNVANTFLGKSATNKNELSVSLDHLDCTSKRARSGRHVFSCASQTFDYFADIAEASALIYGDRYFAEDFSDAGDLFGLTLAIFPDGTKKHYCFYGNDFYKQVCDSLAPQGWQAIDSYDNLNL